MDAADRPISEVKPRSGRAAVRSAIVLPADPGAMRIGGIASFIRSFVRFAPDDFELAFVGVSADQPLRAWTEAEFESRRIGFFPVLRADTTRRGRVPLALRFSLALARHGRPSGLETSILQFHRPGTDLAFRRTGAARIRFVHLSTTDLTHAGAESRWRSMGSLLRRVERDSLRRMDRAYVVNSDAATAYRQRWPELADRIKFLPNFFDDTIFGPIANERRERLRAETLTRLDLPADTRLLLFCGRLDGQKDPVLLLDAFTALRARRPDVGLVIVGDGELTNVLRTRIRGAGLGSVIHMMGTQPRPRVNELMNVSELLVLASRFETGPTVGYEALATGLPVVTTPVGEVARIVGDSGAGAVAADHRPTALAAAIDEVLNADRGALSALARSASAPFAARAVLAPVYRWHRDVSASG
jgi:glycosyltransferase involved in cell wall biosynthesis